MSSILALNRHHNSILTTKWNKSDTPASHQSPLNKAIYSGLPDVYPIHQWTMRSMELFPGKSIKNCKLMARSYSSVMLPEHAFWHRNAMFSCKHTVANSGQATGKSSSDEYQTPTNPLPQVGLCRGQVQSKDRAEWGWGRRNEDVMGWRGGLNESRGSFSNSGVHRILTPFLDLIYLHSSTWTWASYITGAGPSRPTRPGGPSQGHRNKYFLLPRRPLETETPPHDATEVTLVLLHCQAGC